MKKIRLKSFILLVPLSFFVPASVHGEGAWSREMRLIEYPTDAWAPEMATDPAGTVHLVWPDARSGDGEIYHKEWNGVEWGEDERITFADGESRRPQVAADLWGRVHVVWGDKRDGDFEIYYKMRDGASWTPDQRLTFEPTNQSYPSVAADVFGQVHVVWSDHRIPGTSDVYYIRGDGLNWEPEVRLTESGAFSGKPTIAAGPGGELHVAWYDSREGVNEVFYKFWDGQQWSEEVRVSDTLTGSWFQNMAVDSTGNLHLVWLDRQDGNWEVYYRKKNISSGWEDEVRLTHNDAWCGTPSIAVDDAGRVHVVWRDDRDGNSEIYYIGWNETRWTNETRLSRSFTVSQRPAIGVDGDGLILVVYVDTKDGDDALYWIKGSLPFVSSDSERDVFVPLLPDSIP